MKVLKSYATGIKDATIKPKLTVILWLIVFLLASVIYFLVSVTVSDALASNPASKSMMEKVDSNLLFDILVHYGDPIPLIFQVGFILMGASLLISIFLKGGILHILRISQDSKKEQKSQPHFLSAFFQGAGKYVSRFFRLWIYSILLWIGFILINMILTPLGKIITGDGGSERLLVYVFAARVVIGIFLVFLIKMILDYARIKIVTEDSRRVLGSLWGSIKFVFSKLGKTLALFYLLLLTGILFIAVFWFLKSLVPTNTLLTMAAAFIIGQAIIFIRCWSSVTFQAGQLDFYVSEA